MGWDTRRDWIWIACKASNGACAAKYRTSIESIHYNCAVSGWWNNYCSQAVSALEASARGESVTAGAILTPALSEALKCAYCSSKALQHLQEFSGLLAQEVDKKTREIADTYDFCA